MSVLGLLGGLGSGKTAAIAISATLLSFENPPRVNGLVIAPNYKMLRTVDEIAIAEFLFDHGIAFTRNKTEHEFTITATGNTLFCRSAHEPANLRGPNVGFVLGDEPAEWPDDPTDQQNSAVAISLARARHPKAVRHVWAAFGTPKGFNHLYQRFAEPNGERRLANAWYTVAPTHENQYLKRGYVESLKANYDPLLYRQEVLGEFVNITGVGAYHAFDGNRHLRAFDVDDMLPLVIGADFNVNGGWVISQGKGEVRNPFRAIDEITFASGDSTTMACKEFLARYGDHPAGWEVYADFSGGSRKTTGRSDLETIRDLLGVQPIVGTGNPRVKDRVAAVNALLMNAADEVRAYVHPTNCPRLLKDLQRVKWMEGRYELDKSDGSLTHLSDGWGYAIYLRHRTLADRTKGWQKGRAT